MRRNKVARAAHNKIGSEGPGGSWVTPPSSRKPGPWPGLSPAGTKQTPRNCPKDRSKPTRTATASCFGRRPRAVAAGVFHWEVYEMSLGTILLIILIILLIGALPSWPYSAGWGYFPSGGVGLVLVIVQILVLIGRL